MAKGLHDDPFWAAFLEQAETMHKELDSDDVEAMFQVLEQLLQHPKPGIRRESKTTLRLLLGKD